LHWSILRRKNYHETFSIIFFNFILGHGIQLDARFKNPIKLRSGIPTRAECKARSQEQCLDIGDEPEILSAGFVQLQNDWGPEQEVELCDGQMLCQSALEQKTCSSSLQKFISADFTKVYCVELLGKHLVKDLSGFSGYKAGKIAQAQIESLISNGKKAREACQRVLDLIGGFNLLPGRTSDQAGQMVSAFAEAKAALQDGRPTAAKVAIQAIPVDGVLVTQQMKDLALVQLAGY
jgi:hypothetical protein